MEKVGLGSVGLGWWGGELAEAANRSGAGQIVSCFARKEEGRKAFAEKYGCRQAASLDDLLQDSEVEGLLIATPHSTHADLVCEAASAGKHVFVEKPLTLTVAEAQRAVDAASKAGIVLMVGHHRRRQGATRRLREMLDKGELGMVHHLEANLSSPIGLKPRGGWRSDPAECPAGGMTGLGVHMIDNLHYLAGPMKRVSAFSKKLLGAGNLDEITTAAIEFECGALGYLETSTVIPKVCLTAAYGTEGAAWSEEEGGKLYIQKTREDTRTSLPVEAGDALAEELAEFAKCTRDGGTPETGGPEAMEVVAVVEAIIESAGTGVTVEVGRFRS